MGLIAAMLSGGSGGVVFNIGLDGCEASEVYLSVVGLDDCGAGRECILRYSSKG